MGDKRQINVRNIINDLRSGMADWELQAKYKLSAKSLQTIFKKLVERRAISHSELYEMSSFYRDRLMISFGQWGTMGDKRQINGRDILNDLRSGMADSELQVKYNLSEKALQTILKKLVACKAISHSELYEISSCYRDRVDRITGRRYPRADLAVRVPIYDIGFGAIGILRDISETGTACGWA